MASTSPRDMLAYFLGTGRRGEPCVRHPAATDRKLRLFACACFPGDANWNRWAEGEALPFPTWSGLDAARYCVGEKVGQHHVVRLSAADWEVRSALLREVIGNPWRPVCLGSANCAGCTIGPGWDYDEITGQYIRCQKCCYWLTSTVLAIAQRAYAERDWDALPILADALETEGCQDADLLSHLRGQEQCRYGYGPLPGHHEDCSRCGGTGWVPLRGPHVRGCWACDAVLGRS